MKNYYKLPILLLLLAILVSWYMTTLDTLSYEESHLPEDDIIEIRFMSSWAGVDSKATFLELAIEEFEKENPHIKILNESKYGEDFLFTLKADFASGHGPDIFGLWPGSDLDLLASNNRIVNMKEILKADEEWLEALENQTLDLKDGQDVYSLPFEVIFEGLYVNQALFKKYNVPLPEDFQMLKEAVRVFKQNGIIPIAYNVTPEGSYIYQNMVAQLGGSKDVEDPFDKQGQIKGSFIEAMYKMRELYDLGAFPEDLFLLDDLKRNQLFIENKAAMIVQGSWYNSIELDRDKTVIPFPMFKDRYNVIYGVGNGNFHMNTNTYEDPRKREAAISFLKFMTIDKGRQIFNASPSFFAGLTENTQNPIKKQGIKMIMNADEHVVPPDHMINRSFWENVLVKEFPNMLERRISPEEIFEQLESYR